jgi:nitrogen regulatory protein PII
MKLIIAVIQPDRRDAVQAALEGMDVPVIYTGEVLDVRDRGAEMFRGLEYRAARMKSRLEVLVANEMLVEETVAAILGAACAGDSRLCARGNILVTPVTEWIPIRRHEPRLLDPLAA